MNTEQERFERSCEILANIVDRTPTSEELLDLGSLLGLQLSDWYYPKEMMAEMQSDVMDVINWGKA